LTWIFDGQMAAGPAWSIPSWANFPHFLFDYMASQIVLLFQHQKFLKSPFTFFILFFL